MLYQASAMKNGAWNPGIEYALNWAEYSALYMPPQYRDHVAWELMDFWQEWSVLQLYVCPVLIKATSCLLYLPHHKLNPISPRPQLSPTSHFLSRHHVILMDSMIPANNHSSQPCQGEACWVLLWSHHVPMASIPAPRDGPVLARGHRH